MKFRPQTAGLLTIGLAFVLNPGAPETARADLFDELDDATSEPTEQEGFQSGDSLFDELDSATDMNGADNASGLSEEEEFLQWREQNLAEYDAWREQLLKEFADYKRIIEEERSKYLEQLAQNWDDPRLSSNTVWVDYSADLQDRNSVDFENQKITLETRSDAAQSEEQIRRQLTELVTKNKAQAFEEDVVAKNVEERSKEEIEHLVTADVEPAPIILSYLTGLAVATAEEVGEIVDHMMKNREVETVTDESGRTIQKTEVPLSAPPEVLEKTVPVTPTEIVDKLPRKARVLSGYVDTYAERAEVERNLVFAIIETESAFNPMAKSPIPAFGLMQIVPESAGLDATKALFGKEQILSSSYLYNSEQNIEIGTTYLNILYYRYLRNITNPVSRLYCAIAAYNTGAGNVAKAFTGNRRINAAIPLINELEPDQVYAKLKRDLPYDETRRYIVKVNDRMEKYSALGL